MRENDYLVAGILFRIETNIPLRGLKSSRLNRFQDKCTEPDIFLRYRVVPDDRATLPPLNKNDLQCSHLCLCFHLEDALSTKLMCSKIVRDKLDFCLDRGEDTTLEIRPSSVTIFDFASQELSFFFTTEMAGDIRHFRLGADIFTPFLCNFSAFMIHSAGLVRNNKAALFLAPDEGGKTTVVKLSKKGTILCDDQIIIKKEGHTFAAYGTPWGSIFNNSPHAKVGGFFLLEQANRFELIKIRKEDVLEYLWNEHLSYRFLLPKELRIKLFDIFSSACNAIPLYKMRFPKDYVDWDAIDRVMEK